MRARNDIDASVRSIDLAGRERHLEPAKALLKSVATQFSRGARRSLPFLARQRGRVAPGEIDIVGPKDASPLPGPRRRARLQCHFFIYTWYFEIYTDAINLIVDGVLGGGAHDEDAEMESVGPELTSAQRALLTRVVRALAEDAISAFRGAAGIEMKLVAVETLRAGDVPTMDDDALVIPCALEAAGQSGSIVVAVSAESLETATRGAQVGAHAHPDPRIGEALESVSVEVVAELGRAKLGLRRILALKSGDVVRLSTAIDDPVAVCISGIPKLSGAPVVSRGQLSIQIQGRHGE
jgi:flagellar motor switch protein FliM